MRPTRAATSFLGSDYLPRLRFTREEAEAEAKRLAEEYVAELPGLTPTRFVRTYPDRTVPRSGDSKHPVTWVALFEFSHAPGEVVDGGELFVVVNLATKAASIRSE
jgi:hypothetical protein